MPAPAATAAFDPLVARVPQASASMDLFDLLYWGMGAVAIGGLVVGLALIRRRPRTGPASPLARRLFASIPAMIIFGVTVFAVGLQNRIEPWATRTFSYDFTPWVFAFEGRAVEIVQHALRCRALDWILTVVYSVGAFIGYNGPFLLLVALGRSRSALTVAVAGSVIWTVAIVFYTFVPVYEVWMTASAPYHYTRTVAVLMETLPTTPNSAAYILQLNNNFPSLHVAGMAGVTFALRRAGEKTLFWLIAPLAAGVTCATIYLGIHWVVDVVAGIGLGWGASVVGARFSARRYEALARLAGAPAPEGLQPPPR